MLEGLPERIVRKIRVDPATGCWLWMAYKNPDGYGRTAWAGSTWFTHRVTYSLRYPDEEIKGLDIDHLCRQVACCNPDHLEAVPHGVNVIRGVGSEATRRHYANHLWCPQGHPLFGENLYLYEATHSNGYRYTNKQCRKCRAERDRERRARDRAKKNAVS